MSESPSPPPFCGMPEAAGAEFDSEGALGSEAAAGDENVVGVAELEELDDPELPQPAAISATTTTVSAASRRTALLVVLSNVVIAISGLPSLSLFRSRSCAAAGAKRRGEFI